LRKEKKKNKLHEVKKGVVFGGKGMMRLGKGDVRVRHTPAESDSSSLDKKKGPLPNMPRLGKKTKKK